MSDWPLADNGWLPGAAWLINNVWLAGLQRWIASLSG
jgi:hypothetical protein